jgi:hypothetical protein
VTMQVRYGSVALDADSATWTRRERLIHNNYVPVSRQIEVSVYAVVLRDSPSGLALASANLSNGLRVGNRDLALIDGSAGMVESLLSGPSLSGTQVVDGPHFDEEPRGATFATMRTVRFTVSAEYPVSGVAYLFWKQSVSIEGGTPVFVELPSLNGPWQQQQTSPTSPTTVVQRGEAVGISGVPPVPGPLFNLPLVGRSVADVSPDRVGLGFRGYGISWQYVYRTVNGVNRVSPGLPPL